jgi:ABC-type taurine transport system substrate-binding protein
MGGTRGHSKKRAANTDMWNSKSKKKSHAAALEGTAEKLFQELLDGAAELQPEEEIDTEQLNMEGACVRP